MAIPTWLPVVISSASVVLAFSAFIWQVRRARFTQSVDLLFRLENDFFGADKIAQRALAARNQLANPADFRETEDILDFFETLAMLTRRGALDVAMVWHTFDYWIERYYAIARQHIAARQQADPGVWEDLAWLVPRLTARQRGKGRSVDTFTPHDLTAFLEEEAAET